MLERLAGLGVNVQIAQDVNNLNKSPEILRLNFYRSVSSLKGALFLASYFYYIC